MPTNTIQKLPGAPRSFSEIIAEASMQTSIRNTIRDPARADRFCANLISLVNKTPGLKKCSPRSVVTAALLGETLNLNPAPALGQFYVIPYGAEATFVIGYRGLLQLAIRSGEFKRFNAVTIRQGELVSWNPLTEEFRANITEDEDVRATKPIIGFWAMFETVNGFRKETYWTINKLQDYAERYSNGNYRRKTHAEFEADAAKPGADLRSLQKKYGPWYIHFETMAYKTLFRSLLKFAPMSTELMKASAGDERRIVTMPNGDLDTVELDAGEETGIGSEIEGAKPAPALTAPEEKPTIDLSAAPAREKVGAAPASAETGGSNPPARPAVRRDGNLF